MYFTSKMTGSGRPVLIFETLYGYFGLQSTLAFPTAAESQVKINCRRLTDINSRCYGLSLMTKTTSLSTHRDAHFWKSFLWTSFQVSFSLVTGQSRKSALYDLVRIKIVVVNGVTDKLDEIEDARIRTFPFSSCSLWLPSSETQGQLVGSIKCSWWKFTHLDLTVNFHQEHFIDPTNCPWVSEDVWLHSIASYLKTRLLA